MFFEQEPVIVGSLMLGKERGLASLALPTLRFAAIAWTQASAARRATEERLAESSELAETLRTELKAAEDQGRRIGVEVGVVSARAEAAAAFAWHHAPSERRFVASRRLLSHSHRASDLLAT